MSKFTQKLQDEYWTVAILDNTLEDLVNGKPLKYGKLNYNPNNEWYADPFLLDVTDTHYILLVEEYLYSLGRARISKLVINKETMSIEKVVPLLTLPTHLSYPAIIREEDKIYVYPESGLSGKLTRYLYDQENERFIEDSVIMDGPLADATITKLFGDEYLFCTRLPNCNGNALEIYNKDAKGKFLSFQTVCFDENIARMAGDFFKVGDSIYRPVQDCNKSYGNGLVIQEVILKNGKFEFLEVSRYFSPDKEYPTGIHTLNSYKGVCVVDFTGKPKYPIMYKVIKNIKKMFNN